MTLTLGGKIAGKFTKAHPQKSRGKQTCTENAKQNAVPDPAGQSAVEPTLLVWLYFSTSKRRRMGTGFFTFKMSKFMVYENPMEI